MSQLMTIPFAVIAVIVALATTVVVLLRARVGVHRKYAYFAMSLAGYYVIVIAYALAPSEKTMELFATLRLGISILILQSSMNFFDAILGFAGRSYGQIKRHVYVFFVLIFCAMLTAIFKIANEPFLLAFQTVAILLILFVLSYRSILILKMTHSVESQTQRLRLKILAIGGMITTSAFLIDVAFMRGFNVLPIGGVFTATYLYFVSQALMVSRLLDFHELLSKAIVFIVLSFSLVLLYVVLVYWVGERKDLFLFNTLLASILVMILFEPTKTWLEQTTSRLFFKQSISFSLHIRELTRSISQMIDVKEAAHYVLEKLSLHSSIDSLSIYVFDEDRFQFSLFTHIGVQPTDVFAAHNGGQLFHQLLQKQSVIFREALQESQNQYLNSKTPIFVKEGEQQILEHHEVLKKMDSLEADIIIPFKNEEHILGFLAMRDDQLKKGFNRQEIRFLREMLAQLSILFINSCLFNTIKEKERLATLGEMSAGLAHEIRNPLAAIKGAAQVLELSSDIEEGQQLLGVIKTEVDRLNRVVVEFLDYAKPKHGQYSQLSIHQLVKETLNFMEHDLDACIQLDIELNAARDVVDADHQKLRQVLINIVLNMKQSLIAKRAADVNFQGKIVLRSRIGKDYYKSDENLDFALKKRDYIILRLEDNGLGIEESILESIFTPFFTTKEQGTGLGLSICQQIIEAHDGKITVESPISDSHYDFEDAACAFEIFLPLI